MANGATFSHLQECGYRMYAYPGSVSRDLPRIRSSTALALKKHSYELVQNLCLMCGYSPRITAWVLVSMAIFREEFVEALGFLEQASPVDADPQSILEPDGPCPLPEGWRRSFFRGSLMLLLGGNDQSVIDELHRAENIIPTAEVANNLGVALIRQGRCSEAMKFFETAIQRFPEYLDAKNNLAAGMSDRITTHPIRRQSSRLEYIN